MSHKKKTKTKNKLRRTSPFLSVKLIIIIFILSIIGYIAIKSFAATTTDLKTYYPNDSMIGKYYLEGFNYKNGQTRSVLWFEKIDSTKNIYKIYNSGPEDPQRRCNWDKIRWVKTVTNIFTRKTSESLRYYTTHNECNSGPNKPVTEVTYANGVLFLPRWWNGTYYKSSGSTPVSYRENSVLMCSGTNNYTAEVLGREVIDSARNLSAIHWRTTQTTQWTSGPGSNYSGCRPGASTNWQEDYYLIDTLPIAGSAETTKALKRSIGGNKDVDFPNWDVWFDSWKALPAGI